MKKALIGIGTNIGDRKKNIEIAVEALKHVPSVNVLRVSPIYETEPWGFESQADFYNGVIEVETHLTPNALLGVCLGIEAGVGRIREEKNGPRVLDLDMLLYEGFGSTTAELTLPHPRMFERDFVIIPMKDLYPDLKIYNFDVSHTLNLLVGDRRIKKLDF